MKQYGFTLIELMIVVVIIAILAVIAVPSYQRYVIRSQEAKACQAIGNLANELAAWQAKTLSFRGFTPEADFADSSKTIYTPEDGTSSDYKYQITAVDAVDGTIKAFSDSTASGRYWRMKAEPASSGIVRFAHKYYLDSSGSQCMFLSSSSVTLAGTDVCADTNAMEWNCG